MRIIKTKKKKKLMELYRVNGAVYVTKRDTIMIDDKIIDSKNCSAVVMPKERSSDIDTMLDFKLAELIFKNPSLFP